MSLAFENEKTNKQTFLQLHLGGHMEIEVWANLHVAQSRAARGEQNRPNTSIKCMSFTCRNTKVSVTQQAEGLNPWTLQHWISHPLWTRVFKMCATFLSFTLLIGSPVWADYKSYITDSFVFYPSNKGPYFPEIGHSLKQVYTPEAKVSWWRPTIFLKFLWPPAMSLQGAVTRNVEDRWNTLLWNALWAGGVWQA